jgi:DNA-binding SARP family transcriptional activator
LIRVLGPAQVVMTSGRVIEVPSVSQRRLLAVLALHTRTSLRGDRLAETLDVSPGALRTQVSRLRKLLGPERLSTVATGYRLDADVDADLFSNELARVSDRTGVAALEAALGRWCGPALEEFADEEWAAGEAARLTELHASATEDLAAALIAAARWSDAIARLEAHIAAHPLRDRARGLLMEALAAEGRQADALRAFQQYRALLADAVGTEPSAEVREIEHRIATSWATPAVDLPQPAALAPQGRLIGRAGERRRLTDRLDRARTSGLQTIVLGGEAGIGKTTLLSAFAADVRGPAVLYAHCDEGAAVPLQPFRSLVGWCVEQVSTSLLEAHASRHGGELRRIAPRLAARIDVPDPTSSDDATERFLLFEAVTDLLRRIAGDDGLVVMLDDLHWAEPTALSLLGHIARELVDAPVLLVTSFRDGAEHVTDDLRRMLAELERGDVERIKLRGFDDADLADLVAVEVGAGADAGAVAARLREDSAGNPLYATQLLRHWIESGLIQREAEVAGLAGDRAADLIPPSLRDVVWSRVAALGPELADVLSAASVLGTHVDHTLLASVVDADASVVDRALDLASASGLLVPVDRTTGAMRFTHALVANALYAELPPVRRRRLHERAAGALDDGSEDLPQRNVVELARHCALAGLLPDAMRWATTAGDHALGHLAPSEAATWYRAALEHCVALGRPDEERADLTVRLGEAMHRAGNPEAYATLQEGAELAAGCGAATVLVRAALATDRGFMQVGSFAPQQLAIVEAAVDVADPDDTVTYARLLGLFAQSLIHTPRAEQREAVARRALDLATASSEPALLPAIASSVLYALWAPGSSALRAEVAARAIEAAASSGDPLLGFKIHIAAYTVAIELADPVAASQSLATLRMIASAIGAPRMRWTLGIYETFEATMAARLDDAERLATENLDLGMHIGEPDAFTVFSVGFFAIRSFGGRYEELLSVVEQMSKDAPTASPLRIAYAITCASVDRTDIACDILAEGREAGFGEIPRDAFWMTSVIGYAVLAIELRDRDAARLLFPIIEPFAAEVAFNGGSSQGPVSAYLGKLASLLGWHDVADRYLRSALDTTLAFGWEYHRATTLISLAQSCVRRAGALDDDAVSRLDEAERICAAHGLRSWAKQILALRAGDARL